MGVRSKANKTFHTNTFKTGVRYDILHNIKKWYFYERT